MKPKVHPVLLATLRAAAMLPAAAAPLHSAAPRDLVAGPCAPGAVYDPACDVDHDGDIDVLDIQLAAGHWNQSGAWTGANTPLLIGGSCAGNTSTSGAPLILSNTGGDGLRVQQAGTPPGSSNDGSSNGIEVAGAQGRGLYIGQSGDDGVYVAQTGAAGGPPTSDGVPYPLSQLCRFCLV